MSKKLSQGNISEWKQILAELRTMQAQLIQVMELGKEARVRFDADFQKIRRVIIDINQHTCPTVNALRNA